MKKNTIIELLNHFEDDFVIEELIQKVLFVDNVNEGLKEVDMGGVLDYRIVKQRFTDRYN